MSSFAWKNEMLSRPTNITVNINVNAKVKYLWFESITS